ncbi:MAG TPA: hypothetical protein PKY53_01495 [Clostridia bacterium]|jgi:uncharacterized short protein YbdD (DUF466 family)|nr:hypothetical protein [Clostridia bacterium]
MENYAYFDRDGLTAYDKYVLSKKNAQVEEPVYSANKVNAFVPVNDFAVCEKPIVEKSAKRKLSEYDKYLYEQLSRTTPGERVMTEDEFYSCERQEKPGKTMRKLFNNVTFKKGGKLILAVYVIIVIALASILIVANTTDTLSSDFASATVTGTENKGIVRSMTIEENESEQDNWFDRLCDAINK